MIDFSLFCDIHNFYLEKAQNSVSMIIENQYNDYAVVTLLKKCDRTTIIHLTEYFDEGAPIQALLKDRLDELNANEDQLNIEQAMNDSKKRNGSFYQYLVKIMQRKGFLTDADSYNYISMSRQTFAKIRKTNHISRNHALLMAVGLELSYLEAVDFMENAGYAFRKFDSREAIITYIMRNRKYTLYSMEEILFTFGEKSLTESC